MEEEEDGTMRDGGYVFLVYYIAFFSFFFWFCQCVYFGI